MPEAKLEDLQTAMNNGKVLITGVTTSQKETRQRVQYEGYDYFTSMQLEFPGGIDISSISDLRRMVLGVATANALCASNNRKCQVRDGIAPAIGTTAQAFINQKGANGLVHPDAIIEPDKLTGFIQSNLQQLTQLLQQMGVSEQLPSDGTEQAVQGQTEAPPEQAAPKEEKPKAKRTNPRRKKATPATPVAEPPVQEAVPMPEDDVVS